MTRGAAALAVAAVAAAALLGGCAHREVTGLAPLRPALFDPAGRIEHGPYAAAFDSGGTRLAVKSGLGIGVVTTGGHIRLVTPPGSHAVDYAWMPDSASLLIAEGPASTGRFDVLRLDGTSLGIVPLDPAFSVGTGYGMAVSPDGRSAAVITEDLAALGGPERLSLVTVDLATGKVTPVRARAVRGPTFVDAARVFITSLSAAGSRAEVLTLATGQRRSVSPAGESADALGPVSGGHWLVYASATAVWAVPANGGERVRLARLTKGATAVAVDPAGTQAIVAERNGDVEQLRAVGLRGLPVGSSAVRQ